jgi:hypothetical protein
MAAAQLVPIKIPPGFFNNGTAYESSGRWIGGNLVRWENGRVKPIGGWANIGQTTPLQGVARGGLSFTNDQGFPFILIGTNSNLYFGQGGSGIYTDATPLIPAPPLEVGRIDSILGAGYGAGPYGHDNPPDGTNLYGRQRTKGTLQLAAATWQMDTFGNTAVMVLNSDRRIIQFYPSEGTFVVPAGSPTCVGVMTTNEDFLLAIGAGFGGVLVSGSGRNVAWASVGTTTDWTPTDINSAGDINLQTNGLALTGTRVGLQNLVWTTSDVHLINFVGQPAIYAPTRIGTACGLIGPRAWAVAATGAGAGEAAYWMSPSGFYQYNGAVIPMPCEVQDALWRNINFAQAAKIYASTNSRFHEVIWFYPSALSTECDSYVIYNYKDNIWYHGALARTTYLDRGATPDIFGVDPHGVIYRHEVGYLDDGRSRVGQIFLRSGPFDIDNGNRVIYANMMLIDGDGLIQGTGPVLNMTPRARFSSPITDNVYPPNPNVPGQTIPLVLNPEGYTPVMFSGRQIALRFDAVQDVDWSLGKLRLNVVGGSKR